MFRIFDQKSQEYDLPNKGIFIGSKSTTTAEYSTKQEVSFNLSERKDYQAYEYAVKWIAADRDITDQPEDDDIYIVWPIKESKCKALTLSASDFRRNYQKNGLQTIHKKSNTAEYSVWLFKRREIDEFFKEVMLKRHLTSCEREKIESLFKVEYKEGGKVLVYSTNYGRDERLRKRAIEKFKKEHDGKLYCAICDFSFLGKYGEEYIEVHHINPLSEDERGEHLATLDELICVCANCHRMMHHWKPALSPEDLKKRIRKYDTE